MSKLLFSLIVIALALAEPAAALAQSAGASSAGSIEPFPQVPGGLFYRGNLPGRFDTTGFYFSWFMLFFVVGLFALVMWTLNWIAQDSKQLNCRSGLWTSISLLAGVAAVVGFVCAPAALLGLPLFALLYGVSTGLYVYERNGKVPDSGKVLTERHLRQLSQRWLAKIGLGGSRGDYREATSGPPLTFLGKSGKNGKEPDRNRQVESSKGYMAAKELVYDAILRRTTDIHLEPKEDEISVRLRVDGVMFPAEPFDRTTGEAIINIFKVLGAMDITERRKPQDGSFRAETEGREIDFRVATQGTNFGEKMSLRILDQGASVRRLSELGLRKQLLDQLIDVTQQPHGMFLSCGPTGAGKSTTLYASLQEIDRYENNIITIEDPVEYRMDNVTQIEINTKAGQTFGSALRSVLRQDPDVVLIGEIRDAETAKIACQAATTGHMVFSTVHANDTITALFRLIDLGVEPFLLATSVTAILGQRLCRKLCEDCKEPFKPAPDVLEKLGIPADKVDQFYRPPKSGQSGCQTCNGLGYLGRIGVYELLLITDRIRDLMRENPNMSAIKAEARKNGMLYMKEEGLRLVLKGTTSLDELLRVVK